MNKATEEELRESMSGKKCTAAKAKPASAKVKGKRPYKGKPATVNPPEPEATPAPSTHSTPVKSPPQKKVNKGGKVMPRRLNFKSPDPEPASQVESLKKAPLCVCHADSLFQMLVNCLAPRYIPILFPISYNMIPAYLSLSLHRRTWNLQHSLQL